MYKLFHYKRLVLISILFLSACQSSKDTNIPSDFTVLLETEVVREIPIVIQQCISLFDNNRVNKAALNQLGFKEEDEASKSLKHVYFSKTTGAVASGYEYRNSFSFPKNRKLNEGCLYTVNTRKFSEKNVGRLFRKILKKQNFKFIRKQDEASREVFLYTKGKHFFYLRERRSTYRNGGIAKLLFARFTAEELIQASREQIKKIQESKITEPKSDQVSKNLDVGAAARAENTRIANQQAIAQQQRIQQQQQVFINQSRAKNPAPSTGLRQ